MTDPAPETPATPQQDPLASAMEAIDTRPTVTTEEIPDFVDTLLANIGKDETPEATPDPAPAAPVATPAAAPTDEDPVADIPDKPPGQSTPEAQVKWGELKSELKTARADLQKEREARAAEAAKLTKIAELEERASFAENAEKELAIARIEGTREFKRVVDEPLEAIGSAAADLAKRAEIAEDALLDAIGERDGAKQAAKLGELTASMGESDKYRLYRMVEDAATIFRKRDELHTRAGEARKEAEARALEETTQQAAERKRVYETAIGGTLSKLKDRIPFTPLKDGETADAYFDSIKAKATASDFDASAPDVQALAVSAALMLPRLVEQYRVEKAARLAAEKRVQEIHGASPGVTTEPVHAPTPSGDDFVAATMAAVGHV